MPGFLWLAGAGNFDDNGVVAHTPRWRSAGERRIARAHGNCLYVEHGGGCCFLEDDRCFSGSDKSQMLRRLIWTTLRQRLIICVPLNKDGVFCAFVFEDLSSALRRDSPEESVQ